MTRAALVLSAALAALLCACASNSSRTDPTDPEGRRITTQRNAPIPRAAPGPIVGDGAQGLEVHWWLADNSRSQIPRALEPFLDDPHPTDPNLRARWDAAGLRMVRVPLADLPAIEAGATPLSDLSRTWHQAAGIWVEFYRSKKIDPRRASFRIDRRVYEGPTGPLRFVARNAIVPTERRTAAVRLELAAQLHHSGATRTDAFSLPRAVTMYEQGRVFEPLTLRADLEPGFAYIITPEKPGALWREPEAAASDADPRDLNPNPPAPNPSASFGPTAAPVPTLGEAMLTAPVKDKPAAAPSRVLLVLIPRAPETYTLLR